MGDSGSVTIINCKHFYVSFLFYFIPVHTIGAYVKVVL